MTFSPAGMQGCWRKKNRDAVRRLNLRERKVKNSSLQKKDVALKMGETRALLNDKGRREIWVVRKVTPPNNQRRISIRERQK